MKYRIEALLITALVFAACSKSNDEKKTSDTAPNLEIVNSVAQMPNTREAPTNETAQVPAKTQESVTATSLTDIPAKAMIKAMTIEGDVDTFRKLHSGVAIQEFMKAGIINKKPDIRIDYSDMYKVNKPYKFMGHDIVEIQEEYMTKYVGCCVDESVSVILKSNGNNKQVQDFAMTNQCKLNENYDLNADAEYIKGLKREVGAQYIELRCRNASTKPG